MSIPPWLLRNYQHDFAQIFDLIMFFGFGCDSDPQINFLLSRGCQISSGFPKNLREVHEKEFDPGFRESAQSLQKRLTEPE